MPLHLPLCLTGIAVTLSFLPVKKLAHLMLAGSSVCMGFGFVLFPPHG
uniref:Uncharacterized protein n=1 Tax=Arundo donax TaxID=35708 RepID=A0A0A8ZZX3_ARUDO